MGGILYVTAAASLYAQGPPPGGGTCGVCDDWFDSECSFFEDRTKHVFIGTGTSGHEGYHENESCGTCEDWHVICNEGFAQAVEALSTSELAVVIERFPDNVTYDSKTGIINVTGCGKTLRLEATHAQRKSVSI
ncbi:MAG: hypothetical protein WEF86_08885 [Gemmatimonadota bacterium]